MSLKNSRSWTAFFSGHRSEIASYSVAQVGPEPTAILLPWLPGLQMWATMVDLQNLSLEKVFKERLPVHVCWDRRVCACCVSSQWTTWLGGHLHAHLRKFLGVFLVVLFSSYNHQGFKVFLDVPMWVHACVWVSTEVGIGQWSPWRWNLKPSWATW